MKSQSNINQQPFTINELSNGMAEIMFCENVVEIIVDEKTIYEFDMYELSVQNRTGLQEDIEVNYSDWLGFAKGQSGKPVSDKEKIAMLEEKALVTDDLLAELIMGGAM